MKMLLVNNGTEPDNWEDLQAVARAAGYKVTPVHCTKLREYDVADYDMMLLSGGWYHDTHDELLTMYEEELKLINIAPIPIMGICLGMQLMHVAVEGDVPPLEVRQSGWVDIDVNADGQKMLNLPGQLNVFKNHDRALIETDSRFQVLAKSSRWTEIMIHRTKPLFGVQFHPESGNRENAVKILKHLVEEFMRIVRERQTV
jgi:para-aminobenzoate synthetase